MKVTVYDKAYQRKGTLGAPTSIDFDLIDNVAGTATVTVPAHRPRVDKALEDGARLIIETESGTFSGKVIKRAGSGPQGGAVTLTVESDLRILTRLLGLPVPGQDYRKYTGTAEKILKDAVRDAVARGSEPITIAPNLGRGDVIAGGVSLRYHPLADRLLPAVAMAGLSVEVWQDGENGLVVDVRERKVIRRKFSTASGNLVSWEWSDSNPTATDIYGGGDGEGAARRIKRRTDVALEARYGDRIEAFVDARDVDNDADLLARIDEAMIEAQPKSGLSLEIANTKGHAYGRHYRVGDTVTVDTGISLVTDTLRHARFTWTYEAGLVITPGVGERTDDPDTNLARLIKKLRQGMTDLRVSK